MDNSITQRSFFLNRSNGKIVDVRGAGKIAEYEAEPKRWKFIQTDEALHAIEEGHIAAEVVHGD